MTSRPYAYDAKDWRPHGFDAETLAPFDEEKRRAFVRGWYQHLVSRGDADEDQVKAQSADLIGRISRAEYLERLAERPLMLTMITDLHASEGGRIFGGRAKLYERSLGLLVISGEGSHEIPDHRTLRDERLGRLIPHPIKPAPPNLPPLRRARRERL